MLRQQTAVVALLVLLNCSVCLCTSKPLVGNPAPDFRAVAVYQVGCLSSSAVVRGVLCCATGTALASEGVRGGWAVRSVCRSSGSQGVVWLCWFLLASIYRDVQDQFQEVSLKTFKGKYVVLLFYPLGE